LNWILGLKRLGFDVYLVEQISRDACVDAHGMPASFALSENLKYFKAIVEQMGLANRAALVYEAGADIHGLSSYAELIDVADASSLLINISGHLTLDEVKRRTGRRVYVDLDPGFTQFWHAQGTGWSRLGGHDHYFTIGEHIGTATCSIPTCGIDWRPTRQPVVLDYWPVAATPDPRRFTTVATWRGPYAPVEYGGTQHGLKVHEFRKFAGLPAHVDASFEIAVNLHEAEERDRQLLVNHGWRLVNPANVVSDPLSFREYVQRSGAEFSTAQGIYVETNSGWFSDRTVRYLASGKPALVQDTGFSRSYPVGDGLIAFRTFEEAVAGAARILGDYDRHARAARALAERYFDSDRVLAELVDQIEATAVRGARWSA
jgi:hypothetical protein